MPKIAAAQPLAGLKAGREKVASADGTRKSLNKNLFLGANARISKDLRACGAEA